MCMRIFERVCVYVYICVSVCVLTYRSFIDSITNAYINPYLADCWITVILLYISHVIIIVKYLRKWNENGDAKMQTK